MAMLCNCPNTPHRRGECIEDGLAFVLAHPRLPQPRSEGRQLWKLAAEDAGERVPRRCVFTGKLVSALPHVLGQSTSFAPGIIRATRDAPILPGSSTSKLETDAGGERIVEKPKLDGWIGGILRAS